MFIYPYKSGSESAKVLAETLGIKRIKRKNSEFIGGAHKVVINWGCSSLPAEVERCIVINPAKAVALAANKLSFFKRAGEHARTPDWTDNKLVAIQWLEDGAIVVARTVLNGNSGKGIVIVEQLDQLADAPLYTKYVPKKQEYRVHVCNGEVVDVQRKARKKDVADDKVNWKIRNHQNGFVFVRGAEALGVVPLDVLEQAKRAAEACGLDFGAADVIWDDKQQLAYVLEVNTAPGLTGQTLAEYVERFKRWGVVNE